jgi:hypothetical protein
MQVVGKSYLSSARPCGVKKDPISGSEKKKDTSQREEDVLLCRGLLNEVRTFFEGEEGCPG